MFCPAAEAVLQVMCQSDVHASLHAAVLHLTFCIMVIHTCPGCLWLRDMIEQQNNAVESGEGKLTKSKFVCQSES